MNFYPRRLDLAELLRKKSFFLFGPRSTGKSSLIREQLPHARVYDLLDAEVMRRLLVRPKLMAEENPDPARPIVIDEVQRLPELLNEVHRLIEQDGRRFVLTGSSARQLKSRGVNMLAGRAWRANLYPLCHPEIPDFDLIKYLNRGGLPQVYLSADPAEELQAYTALYLREEIQAEALTRSLQSFSRFLDVIALANGEEINFQSLASDCGVSPGTLRNYIEILDDTLLGFSLPGFTRTRKRKATSRAKHYLFDVGVVNSLTKRGAIRGGSELFGKAFEHWLICEVRAALGYSRLDMPMMYWRSTSRFEVDLVLGDSVAIEFKATSLVQGKHLKGLRALREENMIGRFLCVSLDTTPRMTEDGIEILPWQEFLRQLWSGGIVGPTEPEIP